MRFALLVILLGACSFSGASGDPDPVDGGSDGPSMQPLADEDKDGIANAIDNCVATANPQQEDGDDDKIGDACDNCAAVANPKIETLGLGLLQRDHDDDGRGDVCDLCPHLKAAADTDADGDKIGTACDPNDAVKNPPAEFNGFYDLPVASDWQIPGGAGALTDWELTQTPDKRLWWKQKNLVVDRRQLLRNRPDFREAYVDSVFRIHEIAPGVIGNVLRSAAVTYGFFRQGQSDYYFNCGVRRDTSNDNNDAISASYEDDGILGVTANTWTGEATERDIHAVGESILTPGGGGGDSRLLCSASAAPDTNVAVTPRDSQLRPDGRVGLRTYGVTASFDYLFIVDKAVAP